MSNAETKIKRKDPKSMSIEELEEYISRNRNRFKPDNETKSLNSSFQSQRNMNYSFNEPNQGKFNNKFQSGDEQAKTYGLNYSYLNGIKPATNNTTSSLANKIQDIKAKSKDNSPRNKSFNFNNVNNPFIQQETKSSSVNNYITSLQEKIKQLQYENEDLKKNFVQVSELLEKERGNFQQFENDQREFKEEWAHYENENKDLINENEQLKLQLSLQNENIVLLEKEKERHLDQNANEKEILENKISSLIKQDEDNRNRIHSLGEENCLLNEKLLQIEKNLKHLHEENSNFKRENREILKELTDTREFKLKFEKERDEYIQNIKAMKEIVNQVDKEKKEIVKKYERYIRELNVKINKLTGNKMKISTSIPETKKSRSKDKTTGNKLKTQIKKSANNLIAVTDLLGVNRINRSPSLKSLKKVSNVSVGYDSPKSVKSSKSGKKIKKSKKSSVEKKNLTNQNNLGLLSSSNIHSLSSPRSLDQVNMKSPNAQELSYSHNKINQINDDIFKLERNIADLNRNYKNLLIKLNLTVSPEEANLLKRNINIIASNLQEQSENLLELKNQQQELLKLSINNKY